MFLLLTLLSLTVPSASRYWINSTDNTHRFLTFDSHVHVPSLPAIDYVWGAEAGHIPEYRASKNNKNTVLSHYIPFARGAAGKSISWWKANHPSWIWYQCDRKTPAYTFGDPAVPIDITNPDVITYQINTYAKLAKQQGYDAIAADNYGFWNGGKACGVWKNSTTWKQLFPPGKEGEVAYADAVLNWVKQFYKQLHAETGMLLIPNYSLGDLAWNDPKVLIVGNYTDGILSERGFTAWGSKSGFVKGTQWWNEIRFMQNLQRAQKAYYSINEFGESNQDIPAYVREWAVGSYLMGKAEHSAVFISGIQKYGYWQSYPELFAAIGVATSNAQQQKDGVVVRSFSNGLVLANPTEKSTQYVLDSHHTYRNVTGGVVSGTVSLNPTRALILLTSSVAHG